MDKVINIIGLYHRKYPKFLILNLFFVLSIPVLDIFISSQFEKLFNPESGDSIIKIIILIVFFQIITKLNSISDNYQYAKLECITEETALKNIIKNNRSATLNDLSISEKMFDMHGLVDIVTDFFYSMKTSVIPFFIFTLLATGYFFYVDPRLGLLMMALAVANLFFFRRSINSCEHLADRSRRSGIDTNKKIEDILSNLQIVQMERKEKKELKNIVTENLDYMNTAEKHVKCYSFWDLFLLVLFFIILYGIIRVSNSLKSDNRISVTRMFILFFIIRQLISYQSGMGRFIRVYNYDIPAIKKIGWMLDTSDIKKERTVKLNRTDIEFKNVSFSYGDKSIIDNISFKVKNGDKVLIKGKIGSGKTTILKMILGFIKPDSGKIYINGKDFTNNMALIQRHTGYMVQNPPLFDDTIINNVKYSNSKVSDEKIIQTFKKLGIYDRFSHGLDTKVGKNGNKLSGGQKQLVYFVRMYLKNPKLIILDEPTSSLDDASEKLLDKLIKDFIQDKTVIIVSHDDFLIDIVDKVIRIDKH